MKKIIILLFLLFFGVRHMLYSQDKAPAADGGVSFLLPIRNSLKFNRYILNPTFSFVREQNRHLSFYSKRQWVQFENAPVTYFFSYSGKFGENEGIGIGLFQQNIGLMTTSGVVANFAHNVVLEDDSNLSFGANVSFYKNKLDQGKVISNDSNINFDNITSSSLVTINPGLNYGNGFFDVGLSMPNLVVYNFATSEMVKDDPEKAVEAHLMYTGNIGTFGFSGLLRSEFKKEKTVISGLAMVSLPLGFWAQGGYNTLYGMSGGFGVNITSKIAVEYNYEKGTGSYSNFGASHEFLIAYKFKSSDYNRDDQEESLIGGDPKKVLASKKKIPKTERVNGALKAKLAADAEAVQARVDMQLKIKVDTETKNKLVADNKVKEKAAVAEDKLLADAKAKADADGKNKLAAENKAKEYASSLDAKLLADAKAKADADAKNKLTAEYKAKEYAAALEAKLLADAKVKADADAKNKLAAENKAKEGAAALDAKLLVDAKVKADADAKNKLTTENKAKEDAALEAKLLADVKVQADADAKNKLTADNKAKEDAAREAKLLADAKVKADTDAKNKLTTENKAKEDAALEAKLLADVKVQADADAKNKLAADNKAKEDAAREAKLLADAKVKADTDAKNKLAAENKAKEDAAREAKLLADAKVKADTDAKNKLAAENKAKEDAAALEAKLLADAKVKADADAKNKLAAENKAKEDAALEAKLLADAKVKADADAKNKLAADNKAKEDAAREAKLLADAKLKAKAEEEDTRKAKLAANQKGRSDAESLEAKLAAEDKIIADNANKLKLEEDLKAKEEKELKEKTLQETALKAKLEANALASVNTSKDKIAQEMDNVTNLSDTFFKRQTDLLNKLTGSVARKQMDLDDHKEENDLSDKELYREPKPFKSVTAENQELEDLKFQITEVVREQKDALNKLTYLFNERLKKVPNKNDELNKSYLAKIENLKAEQVKMEHDKDVLMANLEKIRIETEIEKKRRIKRAAFENDEGRYKQDRATLKTIIDTTKPATKPFKSNDFDYGVDLNQVSMQIVKNIKNISSGYYLVIAVHTSTGKRDEFVKKVVASGRSNIDFFYNVKDSKYYIYYYKYDTLQEATKALELRGSTPYNGKMSIVVVENQ